MTLTKTLRQIAQAAIVLATCAAASAAFAAPINSLDNAGFEDPYQGQGYTYYGGQTVSGWMFEGGSGLAGNNSAFFVSNASGNQAAFIQSAGSSISQAFDFSGGYFSVSFLAEYRNNYGGNTINVSVDGQKLTFGGLDAFSPSTGSTFSTYQSDLIELAAGQHVLTFAGTSLPDYTTFVDDVSISAVPEPGSLALLAIGALGAASFKRRRKA